MRQKSILITGCSSGIGEAAAETFRKRGYRVFASARRSESVQMLAGRGFEAVQLDLANEVSVERAVYTVLDMTGGQLDAVIHNGGYGQYGALEDLSRTALIEQFQANVFGTHQINQLVIPLMRENGGGRIVIVTSVLGFVALKYRGLYVASKFALEGMADTMRLELADTNIKVSLVEPGPIETRFRRNALIAFRRNVDPIASAHASDYRRFMSGLAAERSPNKFALEADACMPALLSAVHSPFPRARYRITVPTRLFGLLKRILPDAALDRVLARG